MKNQKITLIRAILFCLLCAATLAIFSGTTKGLSTEWKEHLLLLIAIIVTYCLVIAFTMWEKLGRQDVGIVPNKSSFKKLATGFGIGLLMTALQPAFVLLFGHYKIDFNPHIPFQTAVFYLTLYLLVAIREELAFRSYPLFSLNYRFGLWPAQLTILVIFSLEHVAGGMTWGQAFLGPGTGALLFGFAALKTNGIALPFGLHFAWNFGQWCFGFKKETGLLQGIAEKGFENVVERNAWISYLIIMVIAILAFYFYKPKKSPEITYGQRAVTRL
ncbi:type II CAAX endopeptidase family protein [Danxiaibacter flavus]|uniref:Type II CAAX endopeptidase family protein n=1 Tax=Danxiaibacter flavus TaxID=3049108 RepID=A0ABV3ZJV2_9BACT|nr:type II CAAX endopeptidase family protein [Chitinophagaceae bacterium DXS]